MTTNIPVPSTMTEKIPVPSLLYTHGTDEIKKQVENDLKNAVEPENAEQAIASNVVEQEDEDEDENKDTRKFPRRFSCCKCRNKKCD